tara:strand:- start:1456 stop:2367 length:912 start_codon:yes stop_codon:yes gene_type:complete
MLWTEKYRPSKLSEIVGQDGFVRDAEHWVTNKEMPNVLLYGIAGTGKTTAALVLARSILDDDLELNFFEVNASDDRKLETVRTTIKDIATTRKTGDAPFKIVLLDEMDGMTPDAQNALKRIMERYSENVRFVITCNHRHKIIQPLISRTANYNFVGLDIPDLSTTLSKVLQNEGLKGYTDDEWEPFIEGLNGDLRRGLTELQAAQASGSSLRIQTQKMLEPYEIIVRYTNDNDYDNALKEVHKLLLQSVDMKTVCIRLHDVIVQKEMHHTEKFKLLRIIGEAEWRSNNMTPKVLASWMIGQMV